MTKEEFDNTSFTANMRCFYSGSEFKVSGANFEERLIEIKEDDFADDESLWVRCENVTLKAKG